MWQKLEPRRFRERSKPTEVALFAARFTPQYNPESVIPMLGERGVARAHPGDFVTVRTKGVQPSHGAIPTARQVSVGKRVVERVDRVAHQSSVVGPVVTTLPPMTMFTSGSTNGRTARTRRMNRRMNSNRALRRPACQMANSQ